MKTTEIMENKKARISFITKVWSRQNAKNNLHNG